MSNFPFMIHHKWNIPNGRIDFLMPFNSPLPLVADAVSFAVVVSSILSIAHGIADPLTLHDLRHRVIFAKELQGTSA